MTVNKKKLTNILYDKLNQTLKKQQIDDAISIICEYIVLKITSNQSLSIKNFGTFSPYIYPKHLGFNVAKGKLQEIEAFLAAKFHPHVTFIKMLRAGRKKHSRS